MHAQQSLTIKYTNASTESYTQMLSDNPKRIVSHENKHCSSLHSIIIFINKVYSDVKACLRPVKPEVCAFSRASLASIIIAAMRK